MSDTVEVKAKGASLAEALAALALPAPQPGQPTVDPFPPNPADAPFPSPDRSTIQWLANTTPPGPVGAPYLRGPDGNFWTLGVDPAQAGKVAAFVNGLPKPVPTGGTIVSLIVAGSPAVVWFNLLAGQFQFYAANGGVSPAAPLPPPISSAPPAPPAIPADPPHSAIAPGSSGKVIPVGPSQTIKTLAAGILAAVDGDTIQLDRGAVFKESIQTSVSLLIDGQGDPATFANAAILDGIGIAASALALGKGAIVPGKDITIRNLEIRNYGMAEAVGGGTAAIRPKDTGCGWLQVQNCWIHDCQNGLFGGSPTVWQLSGNKIEACGLGPNHGDLSHNMYFSTGTIRVEMTNTISQNPVLGHAFKCRVPAIVVSGCVLASDSGSCFDFPNGLTNRGTFTACIFKKNLTAADHHVGGFGEEGATFGTAGLLFSGCDLSGVFCQGPFIAMSGGTITFDAACKLPPTKMVVTGTGTLVGA